MKYPSGKTVTKQDRAEAVTRDLYALRVMASALAYIASQGIAGHQAWQGLNERFDRALWNGASDDAAPQAKS